ncbi:adenylyltransferase/cytidyltransferase family protein [Quadrisphaera sp. KR29]|uniref:adenylyltransferase/cytidyltransferase family protein n=1 Tax=Quadrisphaera sp. KR29 TaxID=3461391 RepID=UPI004044438C
MTHEPAETTVVTFGTFDVFHHGHLKLLQRAADLGNRLIVGVSSDALNISKKGRPPVYSEDERIEIISGLRCVSGVFLEESLAFKRRYLLQHRADVLVMGDDWSGRFDDMGDICRVLYLPRTPDVSTTSTLERIRADAPRRVALLV